MRLVLIAAVDKNFGIGYENELLVKLKKDMKYFKEKTLHHVIVMGKNTYLSIGRPLPKRNNIVITHHPVSHDDVTSMGLEEFLDLYKDSDEEIYCIGGASLYKELLPYADELLLTKIEKEYKADAYFPETKDFIEVERTWETESGIRFAFTRMVRK